MINQLINKKILLLILFLLILFLFLIILLFLKSFSNQEVKMVSQEYQQITIKNNLAKKENFSKIDKKKVHIENLSKSLDLIQGSLERRAPLIDYDKEKIKKSFSELNEMISQKRYKESLEKTKETLGDFNEGIEDYKKTYNEDMAQINKVLEVYLKSSHEAINYYIDSPWASVTLAPSKMIPKEIAPDSGVVVLKKGSGGWEKILGPTTYLPELSLSEIGAPEKIIQQAKIINEDALKPFTY